MVETYKIIMVADLQMLSRYGIEKVVTSFGEF